MPLNYPLYKVGDRVEFDTILHGDPVRTFTGTIQVVDSHGTYETCYADVSYDINADGIGWIRHVPEIAVRAIRE